MFITNYDEIASVTPIYPDLMSKEAEGLLINLFKTMKLKEQELSQARMKVNELESEVKQLKDDWNHQSSLFEIEFKKKEVKEIKEEYNLSIMNKDDARNW